MALPPAETADVSLVPHVGQNASENQRKITSPAALRSARDGGVGGLEGDEIPGPGIAEAGAAAIDTFAQTRADIQARNTYNSIAQQAMAWVPILNIVLTVVFFAMFPVILDRKSTRLNSSHIPLSRMPSSA